MASRRLKNLDVRLKGVVRRVGASCQEYVLLDGLCTDTSLQLSIEAVSTHLASFGQAAVTTGITDHVENHGRLSSATRGLRRDFARRSGTMTLRSGPAVRQLRSAQ
jgi:hypothetical protein